MGAHFHAWTREWPYDVPPLGDPPVHAMAHCLGRELEEEMLDYTCGALEFAFGTAPKSYRGGRWSFGPESPRSLVNCGIEVDSSVVPGLSFANPSIPWANGPDYRKSSRQPHYIDGGGARIVELPVGAAWRPAFLPMLPAGIKRMARITGLGHRWLRPTSQPLAMMRSVMESLRADNVPVWVMMIHSSELIPCTPLPSQERVDAFRERCAQSVRMALDLGAEAATLSEAAAWWRAGPGGADDRFVSSAKNRFRADDTNRSSVPPYC